MSFCYRFPVSSFALFLSEYCTNLLFVSRDLPILDIMYKQNYTICDICDRLLLCTKMFPMLIHIVAILLFHSFYCCWLTFHCIDICVLFIISWKIFELVLLLTIINNFYKHLCENVLYDIALYNANFYFV